MASHGKKKITMAKLNREARLRERRLEKAARKVQRRQLAERGPEAGEASPGAGEELASDPDAVVQADRDLPDPETVSAGQEPSGRGSVY